MSEPPPGAASFAASSGDTASSPGAGSRVSPGGTGEPGPVAATAVTFTKSSPTDGYQL
ncbi:hypothetical protein ACIOD2_31500 [Amycolatopsis sp. NPDC088138]|uniref:hypothetical protein n=1 Tax=Amycolatopsis sp. NPDC088138 TaxID=3363938 RepID=UPI003809A22D